MSQEQGIRLLDIITAWIVVIQLTIIIMLMGGDLIDNSFDLSFKKYFVNFYIALIVGLKMGIIFIVMYPGLMIFNAYSAYTKIKKIFRKDTNIKVEIFYMIFNFLYLILKSIEFYMNQVEYSISKW